MRIVACLLLLLGLLLAGCTVPIAPEREDPMKGVLETSAVQQGASSIPAGIAKSGRLAIITTESTSKQVQYSKAYFQALRENPLNKYSGNDEFARPGYLVAGTVAVLREYFGDVVLASSIADAKNKGAQWIVVIDLALRYPDNYSWVYRFAIDAYVFSNRPEKMFTASGAAEETNTCAYKGESCFSDTATRVMDHAYGNFRMNLSAAVR